MYENETDLVSSGTFVRAKHDGVSRIIVHVLKAALDFLQQLDVLSVARQPVGGFDLSRTCIPSS
jgi:hypothetical protein